MRGVVGGVCVRARRVGGQRGPIGAGPSGAAVYYYLLGHVYIALSMPEHSSAVVVMFVIIRHLGWAWAGPGLGLGWAWAGPGLGLGLRWRLY